ncbi:MAG: glycoside hydrolase family 19 protein [Candidatus Acidiferrales bacterium]
MNFPLPVELISAILGPYGPIDNVRANWPLVESALDSHDIYSPLSAVAAISTIGVETGRFYPIRERGGPTYLTNLYENRRDLGNVNPGDGAKFCGRGFIQITGRVNYAHFGSEIGRDLEANPDLALDPAVASEILALFFIERHITLYAEQQNWEMVRRRVNGGLTGWPRFIDAVTKLVSALKNPPPPAAGNSQEATQ